MRGLFIGAVPIRMETLPWWRRLVVRSSWRMFGYRCKYTEAGGGGVQYCFLTGPWKGCNVFDRKW